MSKKAIGASDDINFSRTRFWVVVLVMGTVLMVLIGRLVQLQLLPNQQQGYEFLQKQGEARQLRFDVLPASRGLIVDRNNQPLAVSVNVVDVWVNPQYFKPSIAQIDMLSGLLSIDAQILKNKLERNSNKYVLFLSRQLSPDYANAVKSVGAKGLYATPSQKRYYPAGEVAAQILGVTDMDNKGLEGVELLFNQWLQAKQGKRKVIKDLNNNIIDDLGIVESPVPGKELQLTLDLRIQYYAYKALKQAVINHRAKSAQGIVVDVSSGDILAMVSLPSFNPNDRSNLSQEEVRNRVVSDMFEPGSTMKPLTLLAAMEQGEYTVDSIIDTNPGTIVVGKKMFYDPVNYGAISLEKILQKSSQVGAVKVALSLDGKEVVSIFQRLGLGLSSGIGFAGELSGGMSAKSNLSDVEQANLAFGYGLEVSALQLAKAYAVIANDGRDVELKINGVGIMDDDVEAQQIVKPALAQEIRSMLVSVTEKGGTAPKAAIVGYKVAGKSGTTHKLSEEGYDNHNYRAIFVGMAPAEKPEVVTVVVVDNPTSNDYSGGAVAAPVFADITAAALRFKAMDMDVMNAINGQEGF